MNSQPIPSIVCARLGNGIKFPELICFDFQEIKSFFFSSLCLMRLNNEENEDENIKRLELIGSKIYTHETLNFL